MEKLGSELVFISWIIRDGSGTIPCGIEWKKETDTPKLDDMSYEDNEIFKLTCLSLSKRTFIASGFNSFIVKLKKTPK